MLLGHCQGASATKTRQCECWLSWKKLSQHRYVRAYWRACHAYLGLGKSGRRNSMVRAKYRRYEPAITLALKWIRFSTHSAAIRVSKRSCKGFRAEDHGARGAQASTVNPKNFFAELKRRNVYKVAIAYAVVAWLLIQVATQVFPFFEIPNWASAACRVLLIVIGFPVALILAWAFELTPEGIKRTETCG